MGLLDPRVGERKRGHQCWLRPFEWAGLPRRERPAEFTSEITSPLNGLVIFLKSLSAAVCELASSVGRELRAHSGLRRMETWKGLRMMSDKARVFETVSAGIFSLALEFVTPRRRSLSWNWVCLREPRAPTVKLACVRFQGRPALCTCCICFVKNMMTMCQ